MSVAWPLSVAPTRRHLQDAAGAPFRVNVDAAWFAPTEFWLSDPASAAAWDEYLRDRAARGFTGILMMGMVQTGYDDYGNYERGGYAHLPANRLSGVAPLAEPGVFSTPVPEYWDNVRRLVARAASHGIAVCLAYNYLGYPGTDQGWWKQIAGPGNDEQSMRWFGGWLAEYLAKCPNIIWYPYGDMNPPPGEGSRRVRATIEAIQRARPGAVFAAELGAPDDVIGDNPDADELLSVNSFYGYGPEAGGEVWRTADEAWRAMPERPCWTCEPQYESAGIGGSGSAADVREAEWWSVLGGGTAGQVYGRSGVYNFAPESGWWGPDWRSALGSPGAVHMSHQFAFWASLPWWDFVPAGHGERYLGYDAVVDGQADGLRHIAAAGTPDGRHLAVYVPNRDLGRSFTVDTSRLGDVAAEWFDPTSGLRHEAGDGPFTTPGRNADGDLDWVLLFRPR